MAVISSIIHQDAARGDFITVGAWLASLGSVNTDTFVGVICDNAEYTSNDTILTAAGTGSLGNHIRLTANDGVLFAQDLLGDPLSSVRHTGQPGTGARLQSTNSGDHVLIAREDWTWIDHLELRTAPGGGSSAESVRVDTNANDVLIDSCLLWSSATRNDGDGVYMGSVDATATVVNCGIWGHTRAGLHQQATSASTATSSTVEVYHCGLFGMSNSVNELSGGAFRITSNSPAGSRTFVMFNNWAAAMNFGLTEFSDGQSHNNRGNPDPAFWNGSHNGHHLGLGDIDGTLNATNWIQATDGLTDVAQSSGNWFAIASVSAPDFTPIAGAGNLLLGTGADLSTITPTDPRVDLTVDMVGNPRPVVSPDLGPIQFTVTVTSDLVERVFDGAAWVDREGLVFDGASFEDPKVSVWDGAGWVP